MPPPTESEIRSLLSSESYSPSILPPLEEYLQAQVCGEAPYVFDAVRTLVKLYQLFPEKAEENNLYRAHMLTLLEFPNNDNLALTYLTPQTVLSEQNVCSTVQTCMTQLTACQFPEFWKTYEALEACSSDPMIAKLAQRSVTRMQKSILQVLALTYKEAPSSVVCAALKGISVSDVSALQSPIVERASEDGIVFVSTRDNTKRETVYQEGVNFNTISSLLSKIAQ